MPDAKVSLAVHTRATLAAHGLAPRKRLGQNFLVDEAAVEAIVGALELSPDDCVLEVGAGLGALTVRLAEQAAQVLAVEKDAGLAGALAELVADRDNVALHTADILDFPLDHLAAGARAWKIVGNLPYYLTTPILERFFTISLRLERIVFTVQTEVADRLRASPGTKEYGSLTVWCEHFIRQIEVICRLRPGCFYPSPQIESTVLRLLPRCQPAAGPRYERRFSQLVRGAFGQRRKMLVNALLGARALRADRTQIERVCAAAGIDPRRRGETLSHDEFLTLAQAWEEDTHAPPDR